MTGLFAKFQPLYAEYKITAIPCSTVAEKNIKKPLVSHWQKMGIPASHQLAKKFPDANAIGFASGRRNRVTVLDVDVPDERVLQDAIAQHGEPAIIVRTASGKYHAYYRWNGEPRRIRPWGPERPIDVLGERGIVMAPSSLYGPGQYEIIRGSLDDLARLTPMQGVDDLKLLAHVDRAKPPLETIGKGRRNDWLWRECMKHLAHADCENLFALIAVAKTFNERCNPKMEDTEVMTISASAWTMHQEGRNRFGQHGAWIPIETIVRMAGDSDALFLYAHLKANEGPWAEFMIVNTLAEKFGWTLKRLQAARRLLIESGYIRQTKLPYPGSPALYQWQE